MIKKRDEKRIPFRKLVICKCGGEMHPGFIQDVSQHGIGIQTMQRPSLFHKVRIALAVDQESIFLDGEVRWAQEYYRPPCRQTQGGGHFHPQAAGRLPAPGGRMQRLAPIPAPTLPNP